MTQQDREERKNGEKKMKKIPKSRSETESQDGTEKGSQGLQLGVMSS